VSIRHAASCLNAIEAVVSKWRASMHQSRCFICFIFTTIKNSEIQLQIEKSKNVFLLVKKVLKK
jgi:hypothetical protein